MDATPLRPVYYGRYSFFILCFLFSLQRNSGCWNNSMHELWTNACRKTTSDECLLNRIHHKFNSIKVSDIHIILGEFKIQINCSCPPLCSGLWQMNYDILLHITGGVCTTRNINIAFCRQVYLFVFGKLNCIWCVLLYAVVGPHTIYMAFLLLFDNMFPSKSFASMQIWPTD